MGRDLSLTVPDDSIEGPDLSRGFLYSIVHGLILNREEFLTEAEIDMLRPDFDGEVVIEVKEHLTLKDWFLILLKAKRAMFGSRQGFGDPNAVFDHVEVTSDKVEDRVRDPLSLLAVLRKVHTYLVDHADTLPQFHTVYSDPGNMKPVQRIPLDGGVAFLKGEPGVVMDDRSKKNLRHKILVSGRSAAGDPFRYLVDVQPEIELGGKKYYVQSETVAEYYSQDFDACFTFLEKAAAQKKQVLWEDF